MSRVEIIPLPESWRKIPRKYQLRHPPIFPDGEPTAEDIELACELFKALDSESQEWYRRCGSRTLFDGL